MPKFLVKIQPVADDEPVLDAEGDPSLVGRPFPPPVSLLLQKNATLDARRAHACELLHNLAQREACVDYVLDDDDVAARDMDALEACDVHLAGGLGADVRLRADELDLVGDGEGAREVCAEDEGALEHD